MVELNLNFIMRMSYLLAKYSFFVFQAPNAIIKKFDGIFKFLIITGLNILAFYYHDAWIETFHFVPSLILEFGLNVLLKSSIIVTVPIRINNFIAKNKFSEIVKNIFWCNKLVSF